MKKILIFITVFICAVSGIAQTNDTLKPSLLSGSLPKVDTVWIQTVTKLNLTEGQALFDTDINGSKVIVTNSTGEVNQIFITNAWSEQLMQLKKLEEILSKREKNVNEIEENFKRYEAKSRAEIDQEKKELRDFVILVKETQRVDPSYLSKVPELANQISDFLEMDKGLTVFFSVSPKGDTLFGIKSRDSVIIKPKYQFIGNYGKNGLAPYRKKNRMGYLNPLGYERISPKYEKARPFYDDLALVSYGNRYKFINAADSTVIELGNQFAEARSFSEGKAWVKNRDGSEAFIDRTGRVVFKAQNCESEIGDFFYGFATFKLGDCYQRNNSNGKYGYLDEKGSWRIYPTFDKVFPFTEHNVAVVEKDGNAGLINRNGQNVTDFEYREIGEFHNDIARCRCQNGLIGGVDSKGVRKVSCDYKFLGNFYNDFSVFEKENGLKGVVSKFGFEIVEGRYDSISIILGGRLILYVGKTKIIADERGNFIENSQLAQRINGSSQIIEKRSDYFVAINGDSLQMFGLDGKIIRMDILSNITTYEGNNLICGCDKKSLKFGCYDNNLSIVIPFEMEDPPKLISGINYLVKKNGYFIYSTGLKAPISDTYKSVRQSPIRNIYIVGKAVKNGKNPLRFGLLWTDSGIEAVKCKYLDIHFWGNSFWGKEWVGIGITQDKELKLK
ncbi:MAG: WG repeat-containing protein [Bacteroidia bacterium]|nr:WG repeat-containing protein [Bacteroidia bacterium]